MVTEGQPAWACSPEPALALPSVWPGPPCPPGEAQPVGTMLSGRSGCLCVGALDGDTGSRGRDLPARGSQIAQRGCHRTAQVLPRLQEDP